MQSAKITAQLMSMRVCVYRYCLYLRRDSSTLKRKLSSSCVTRQQCSCRRVAWLAACSPHLPRTTGRDRVARFVKQTTSFFRREARAASSDHTNSVLFSFSVWMQHLQKKKNLKKTRWHRGQSHRKLRRQTTSHPAWAFWKKHFLLSSECNYLRSLSLSHVKGSGGVLRDEQLRYDTTRHDTTRYWKLKARCLRTKGVRFFLTVIFGGTLHSQIFQVNNKWSLWDTEFRNTTWSYTLVMAISWTWGSKGLFLLLLTAEW